jgi:hypothetical protein
MEQMSRSSERVRLSRAPCVSAITEPDHRGGIDSLAAQYINRSDNWILRGSRAEVNAPKFAFTWSPVALNRAVVFMPEN